MKYLFVDDIRSAPTAADAIARNYNSAIQLLKFVKVEVLDLDYSLNDINGNGLKILEFMVANNIKVKEIKLHTDHYIGKTRMDEYIKENYKTLILENEND